MDSSPTSFLPDLPANIQLTEKKGVWELLIKKRRGNIVGYVGGLFFLVLVVLGGFIPEMWELLWSLNSGWTYWVVWVLMMSLFVVFCWLVFRMGWGYLYHSQQLKLLLHQDRFFVVQYTILGWVQQHQLFYQEDLEAISLEPIHPSRQNPAVPALQQGLFFQKKEATASSHLWGDYLPQPQLEYLHTLLQQLYIQGKSQEILATFRDLSEHLLED